VPSDQKPSAPVAIALRLLDAASDAGADRGQICAAAGFDPAASTGLAEKVPLETLFRLWEAAISRLREPGFPIAVAETYRPESYGVLTLMAITSRDLHEACVKAMRFYRLWTNSSWWELERHDSGAHLAFVQPGELELGQRCDQEFSLAEMVNAIRYVTGLAGWGPLEVRFRHGRPRAVHRHEAHFRAKVQFDATKAELVLARQDLELPMVRADRLLAEFFERHSEELLRRLGDLPEDILRIRREVLTGLRGRVPRLGEVASKLGVGARTLRRRLVDQGVSFKTLVDQTRSELAREYLEQSRLSIHEISYLLGFSEPSAFSRAFRRWTREAPLQFRERAHRRSSSDSR
jgi:AraC-like DNA-binding protein